MDEVFVAIQHRRRNACVGVCVHVCVWSVNITLKANEETLTYLTRASKGQWLSAQLTPALNPLQYPYVCACMCV